MHFCSRPVSPSIVHFLVVVVFLVAVVIFVSSMSMALSVARLFPHYSFIYVHFIYSLTYTQQSTKGLLLLLQLSLSLILPPSPPLPLSPMKREHNVVFFFCRCDTNVNEIDTKWSIAVLLLIRHLMTHTDSAYENILPVTLFHFPEMVSLKCFHFIDAFSFFCLFFFFLFIFVEVTCSKNVVTM